MKRDKITTITKVTEVGVADYERELYGNLSPVASLVKRGFDVVASLLGLILSSPFFLLIAILIKREDGHSPIYRQERIGYRGKPFTLYKFRSMTICSEKDGKPALCQKDDKRLTKIGRFLRNHHLDELPQLWNVLKGDMSLVGPRPERKYFIERIVRKAPFYYLLHNVRPGITSLGMVKYGYAGSVDEMIERKRIVFAEKAKKLD